MTLDCNLLKPVKIVWIDKVKGILCVIDENEYKEIIHKKQIVYPKRGIRKLKKHDLIELLDKTLNLQEWDIIDI